MNENLTTAWFATARAVHFGACLLAFGVVAFELMVAGTVTRRDPSLHTRWRRIRRGLLLVALPLALLSGAAWFGFNAIAMSGLEPREALQPDVLKIVLTDTHFGKLWQVRIGLWLATSLLLISARRVMVFLGLAASAALAASVAWAGHGLTGEPQPLHLWADAVHILIGGVWPVGLLPFALLLASCRHSPASARLTNRFSDLSLISVALLILTGIVNSCALLGPLPNLWSTPYGKVLLAKILLFVCMVGIGAMNLLGLKPRVASDSDMQAVLRLRRNVRVELILTFAVFAAVGLLGMLAPGIEAAHHHHH